MLFRDKVIFVRLWSLLHLSHAMSVSDDYCSLYAYVTCMEVGERTAQTVVRNLKKKYT